MKLSVTAFFSLIMALFFSPRSLLNAQTVKEIVSGSGASFRGMSVVNKKVAWLAGSGNTIGRTMDGGESWEWKQVTGFEKVEFRDVQAFSRDKALVMGISSPAYIFKTVDGGNTFTKVYENTDTSMFLDAFDFNGREGIAIGDPVGGRIFLMRSHDEGDSWQVLKDGDRPVAANGEASFASSGSNVLMMEDRFAFITGGKASNFYFKDLKLDLGMATGSETAGANGMAYYRGRIAIAGGDFMKPKDTSKTFCVIDLSRLKTSADKAAAIRYTSLPGYRSAVAFLTRKRMVACGITGVDYSKDGGKSFTHISDLSFNVVQKVSSRKALLAGSKGRIGIMKL